MKTIGLIGGMSFESTIPYYQIINETVQKELGGLNSAKILLYSVNFREIEECQAKGDWDKSGKILGNVAKSLELAGADFIVICTNTMHKVAPYIQSQINIPIVHIAEATAEKLLQAGIKTVALLGTKYTMTEDFYKEKITSFGIDVIIPDKEDIEAVNDIIYKELCVGIISMSSKQKYLEIIAKMNKKGAKGIILGCTEIGLLIKQTDVSIPIFDTAIIHAKKSAMMSIY